jgi:NTE family protein
MTGVVLEGGGARGSYQLGALLALKKLNIKIDGIVGTSIGAINAAFIAQGDYDLLEKLWHEMTNKDITGIDDEVIRKVRDFKLDRQTIKDTWNIIISIIKNKGIATTNIKDILSKNIDEKRVRKSRVDYGLVIYSLTDGKPIEAYKEDIPKDKLVDYILASAYFPVFKQEKIIDNKFYIDGGVYDSCPINMLIDRGYKKIIVIRTNSIGRIRRTKENNADITYISNNKKLGPIIFFDQDIIKNNIKLGYFDTIKTLKNLDGEVFYFKKKNQRYYNNIVDSKSNGDLISRVRRKLRARDNRELVIKSLEYILEKENCDKYKIYDVFNLILTYKIKKDITDDIIYKFIRTLKIFSF